MTRTELAVILVRDYSARVTQAAKIHRVGLRALRRALRRAGVAPGRPGRPTKGREGLFRIPHGEGL